MKTDFDAAGYRTIFGDLRNMLGAAMSVDDFAVGADFRALAGRHPHVGCKLERLRLSRHLTDAWELSGLFSLPPGAGHGSRFLRDLASLIEDRQGLIAIRVGPTPFGDPAVGVERLVDFYERHGFIRGGIKTPRWSRMCLAGSRVDPAEASLVMTGFGGKDVWNRGVFLDRLAARRADVTAPEMLSAPGMA